MKSLPTVAWVLLGLIALAAIMLSLGREDANAFPSAASHSPSGVQAFMELLNKDGYKTSVTQSAAPLRSKGDVVVAFNLTKSSLISEASMEDQDPLETLVMEQVSQGGKAILFDLSPDFVSASRTATGQVLPVDNVVGPSSSSLKLNIDDQREFAPTEGVGDRLIVASGPGKRVVASAKFRNKGTLIEVDDGIIVTNRFIDQNDNALEAMRLVRMVAPAGSHLVFTEATFGNVSEPGVLEIMGPWAVAAWWQILILFGVIVYTLGKPFGFPDEERLVQRGARDLVDAIALTYRRSKATHIALQWIHSSADREIRRKLKLPSDASPSDRNRLIPEPLARALARTQAGSSERMRPWDAAEIAADLDSKMEEFRGNAPRPGRRRKSRG